MIGSLENCRYCWRRVTLELFEDSILPELIFHHASETITVFFALPTEESGARDGSLKIGDQIPWQLATLTYLAEPLTKFCEIFDSIAIKNYKSS